MQVTVGDGGLVLLETHWEPVDTFHDCPTKGEGEPRLFFTKSPHSFVEGYCGVGGGGGMSNTPLQPRESAQRDRLCPSGSCPRATDCLLSHRWSLGGLENRAWAQTACATILHSVSF